MRRFWAEGSIRYNAQAFCWGQSFSKPRIQEKGQEWKQLDGKHGGAEGLEDRMMEKSKTFCLQITIAEHPSCLLLYVWKAPRALLMLTH